jgi:hypothetical protein
VINPLVLTRVIFTLGIINVVTGLLIFFSCRCLPGSRLGKRLMGQRWYQGYLKWHCYIWWVFWGSVIVHASFAIGFIGIPF